MKARPAKAVTATANPALKVADADNQSTPRGRAGDEHRNDQIALQMILQHSPTETFPLTSTAFLLLGAASRCLSLNSKLHTLVREKDDWSEDLRGSPKHIDAPLLLWMMNDFALLFFFFFSFFRGHGALRIYRNDVVSIAFPTAVASSRIFFFFFGEICVSYLMTLILRYDFDVIVLKKMVIFILSKHFIFISHDLILFLNKYYLYILRVLNFMSNKLYNVSIYTCLRN